MRARNVDPWLVGLLVVLLVKLISIGAYPLTDTTEARYGEIARLMATTGDWITPQVEVGVPFWAKPPLSFWQGALSMSLFGVSEFSARLPSLINMLGVLVLLFVMARATWGNSAATASVFIAMTSGIGFVNAGAVMTDPALLLSTTLAMVSVWQSLTRRSSVWGLTFFAALALGLLAKGPIAWLLAGAPIVAWLTLERRWRQFFRIVPVLPGCLLLFATATPWFLLAEVKTPGFLNYFLVGEHIQRYLDSGWQGDRYGSAHEEARGKIWWFALLALVPWSFVAGARALGAMTSRSTRAPSAAPSLNRYLVLWTLWPLVFFTFSGNILATYVLPSLPSFSLLLAYSVSESRHRLALVGAGLVLPVLVLFASPLGLMRQVDANSHAQLIASVQEQRPRSPLVYFGAMPHSARFYSRGSAQLAGDEATLNRLLERRGRATVIVKRGSLSNQALHRASLKPLRTWNSYRVYSYEDSSER